MEQRPNRREVEQAFDAAYFLRWSKLPEKMTDYERAVLCAFNEDPVDDVLLWQLAQAKQEDDQCRP